MKFLSDLIVRYAGRISLIGTLLAFIGAFYSVELYKNLRTDIEELLPTTSRSVKDLNEATSRFESIENIVVLVFSKDLKNSKRFVTDLANRLKDVPKSVISGVEYRIDHELQFFKDRRALYIELSDLIRIRGYVRDRINYEKELHNPLNIFQEVYIPEPKFDFDALRKKYSGRVAGYDQLPGGFYATKDEKVRLVVAYMPGKGLDKAYRLKAAIEVAVEELKPQSYASDIEVKYTGNIENLIEESAALVADLELSTVIVIFLVSIAMLLFYRSITATFALVASLFMGTFWAFGTAYFLVGYLNANTAFLASIVIGNGINFGIIFLARYVEERRQGQDNAKAIELSMVHTSVPTWTAALAAGVSYGSLMLTGFRGFNQFGVIGLVGMIFCWLSAYTLLPAYLTFFDRTFKTQWKFKPQSKVNVAVGIAALIEKYSGWVCLCSIIAVGLSLVSFRQYDKGVIEMDLSKLRDKRSFEHGSGALYHYIDDIFLHSLSPTVVLPKQRGMTRQIASLLKEEQKRQGKNGVISSVQILDDFVPKDQEQKIRVLSDIQKILPPKIVKRLPESEKQQIEEFLNPHAMSSFSDKDLPPLILNKFTEKDGSFGNIVLVDKVFVQGSDDSQALTKFVKLSRDIADSVAPETAVAGQLAISYDMFEAIMNDGPKATCFAFIAVIFLVIILFRKLKTVTLILLSLICGILWFAGIVLAFGLKINFLNFIALPITFGIGVDYAVNIFKRYEEEGDGSIVKVIRHTGGAVILSSMTTVIGYSSLLIAGNQAFVSFGRLAVIGELTCAIAAVVTLPALLRFRRLCLNSWKARHGASTG